MEPENYAPCKLEPHWASKEKPQMAIIRNNNEDNAWLATYYAQYWEIQGH
jgi:hypothetical protein